MSPMLAARKWSRKKESFQKKSVKKSKFSIFFFGNFSFFYSHVASCQCFSFDTTFVSVVNLRPFGLIFLEPAGPFRVHFTIGAAFRFG